MIDMAKVFFQTFDTHGHIDLHILDWFLKGTCLVGKLPVLLQGIG